MGNIPSPDIILLWCPIGGAVNPAASGVVTVSSGYPILNPYSNNGVHYTSEVGVTVQLDTGIDLSNATSVSIQVLDPTDSTLSWAATVVALPGYPAGIHSGVQYITQVGDWYYPGTYKVQPVVAFANWNGLGETATFTISMPYDSLGSGYAY